MSNNMQDYVCSGNGGFVYEEKARVVLPRCLRDGKGRYYDLVIEAEGGQFPEAEGKTGRPLNAQQIRQIAALYAEAVQGPFGGRCPEVRVLNDGRVTVLGSSGDEGGAAASSSSQVSQVQHLQEAAQSVRTLLFGQERRRGSRAFQDAEDGQRGSTVADWVIRAITAPSLLQRDEGARSRVLSDDDRELID